MKWRWLRRAKKETTMDTDADQAVQDARASTRRVDSIARDVLPGLRKLEAHRRDNHILDAMLGTLGRNP